MTYLGNPKADSDGCQMREYSAPQPLPHSVVHFKSNVLKTQSFLVHREANEMVHFKTRGALQSKEWCTAKQIQVHFKARNGALRSKFWCTAKQAMKSTMPRFS